MVIGHFDDGDSGHSTDVDTPVLHARDRLVVRLEDEPVGMDEVHRVLSAPLAPKLVPPLRTSGRHQGQGPGVLQDREANRDAPRQTIAVCRGKRTPGVESFFNFPASEGDIYELFLFLYMDCPLWDGQSTGSPRSAADVSGSGFTKRGQGTIGIRIGWLARPIELVMHPLRYRRPSPSLDNNPSGFHYAKGNDLMTESQAPRSIVPL